PLGQDAVHRQTLVAVVRADEHAAPVAADGRVMVVPAGDPLADVLLQPRALRGVLESCQHFRLAALVGPGRQDAGQVVVAARVRIDVGADIDPALAGRVDQLDDLAHAPPVGPVGDLDVQDLHGHAGPPADFDDLA